MEITYFSAAGIFPFFMGMFFLILSIFFFLKNKQKTALYAVFFCSLSMGFFIANLDPFLSIWDEQFHALVAKNIAETPFMPRLYPTPVLEYDYLNWTHNYIWLHKQPLFLWQMALSIKIFGATELAVRIPSILMVAFASVMVYRIGKIAHSERVGFYGALFFTCLNYTLELITGEHTTDHNDIAFLFYMTATFWAWFEYQNKKSNYWLLLIGLFSGCAILVKWLVGLLIYGVWFLTIGEKNWKEFLKIRNYYPLLIAFGITLCVFLPWQFFILSAYPKEAAHEFSYNTLHFYQPVEGHGGDWMFHFDAIKEIYGAGTLVPFVLLIGLFFLIKDAREKKYRIVILASIVVIYAFFTIAATKMMSFCYVVAPFALLAIAALTDKIIHWVVTKIRYRWFNYSFTCGIILIFCYSLINMPRIVERHVELKGAANAYRAGDLELMAFIKKLPAQLKDQKYVIFTTEHRLKSNIPIMFYTDYIAYDFIPTPEQLEQAWEKSYDVAVVDNGELPDYICDDARILKL